MRRGTTGTGPGCGTRVLLCAIEDQWAAASCKSGQWLPGNLRFEGAYVTSAGEFVVMDYNKLQENVDLKI